jgi:16S rRNA (cytidine1402-2'-O)-methyltransferase
MPPRPDPPSKPSGKLWVVATPLGNLGDLSPRAAEVLRSVSRIACEDTRRTARLLAKERIETPTFSCHRFNEWDRLRPVVEALRAGEQIALVADGGTPGISDPGALLVRAALEAGIPVSPVAGPSAVTTLLSASGLPADRYVFDGFLPHRAGERRRRLRELLGETRTVVLFEAPHRIRATLRDLDAIFGDRLLVLGRELTKLHETIIRGTAAELLDALPAEVKGEITVALAGSDGRAAPPAREAGAERVVAVWRDLLEERGGDRRSALREAARRLGMKRAELYRLLAELGESTEPGC